MPLDRTDLAEVLGNLLENAARHAARRVRISADTTGPAITIEDDGPGIAPAERARMLERGARLDQRGDGAGLGLAIVQDVLNAYGWRLELASFRPRRAEGDHRAGSRLSHSPNTPLIPAEAGIQLNMNSVVFAPGSPLSRGRAGVFSAQ